MVVHIDYLILSGCNYGQLCVFVIVIFSSFDDLPELLLRYLQARALLVRHLFLAICTCLEHYLFGYHCVHDSVV